MPHNVITRANEDGGITCTCTCGAEWKVGKREYLSGIDHIEDHIKYANRPLTKPD